MSIFKTWFIRYLFSRFKWYRKWCGGRWEKHYIEICANSMWLQVDQDKKWPEYRQPCSRGTPLIEDYPVKGRNTSANLSTDMSQQSLVVRLRMRAEIRQQIATRKSVQEGKPDRLSLLLIEAADEIEKLQKQLK